MRIDWRIIFDIYIFIHQTHGSNDNKDNKNEYYKGLGLQTHNVILSTRRP